MPDAMPTASGRPIPKTQSTIGRRWSVRLLGVLIGLAMLVPAAASAPTAVHAGSCTGWTSTVVPPQTIRVLLRNGTVATVKFRRYVAKVMASGEWPYWLPRALLRAGAQASKQFAWYHSLKGRHRSSFVTPSGECYDVLPTTRDQLFKRGATVHRRQWRAVDAIWHMSLHRNDRFILTPYRAGTIRRCAGDVDGRRLYAKSAKRCARIGWTGKRILRTYYSGDNTVALVSTIGSSVAFDAALSSMGDVEVFVPGGGTDERRPIDRAGGGDAALAPPVALAW